MLDAVLQNSNVSAAACSLGFGIPAQMCQPFPQLYIHSLWTWQACLCVGMLHPLVCQQANTCTRAPKQASLQQPVLPTRPQLPFDTTRALLERHSIYLCSPLLNVGPSSRVPLFFPLSPKERRSRLLESNSLQRSEHVCLLLAIANRTHRL